MKSLITVLLLVTLTTLSSCVSLKSVDTKKNQQLSTTKLQSAPNTSKMDEGKWIKSKK